MKRFIAILLVLVLVFALVGCKKDKREIVVITLSTEDSEAILAAAGITLPDASEVLASGSTVKWFAWFDPFHNYDEDEIVNTGYWTFKEKYGCEIEWIETDYFERNNDLANLILAGTSPDFAPAGSAPVFPLDCIKGMYVPVDDYIDLEAPLWSGVRMKEFFYMGGKHYAIVTDVGPTNVACYNRRVMEEWGFEDPAQLYANDEWTWDVFYDMCLEFSDVDENRFALDGYAYNGAFIESCGQMIICKDENGVFYSNIDAPEIERAQNLLYDLVKNDCTYHEGSNRWALRNGTFGSGMKEGLCLFYIIGTSFFTGTVEEISAVWGDVTQGEVMFVPMPRDPQGDGNYYVASGPTGYMLVSGGTNHEGAALLAACERFKILDPTVVSIDRRQLEEIYLWTDEMLEMYDHIYEVAKNAPVVSYTGNMQDQLNSAVSSLVDSINRTNEPATWGQLKEQYSETIEYYLEEINAMIADFHYDG